MESSFKSKDGDGRMEVGPTNLDEEASAADALRAAEEELEQIMFEMQKQEEERRRAADVEAAAPDLARVLQRRRQLVQAEGDEFVSPWKPIRFGVR